MPALLPPKTLSAGSASRPLFIMERRGISSKIRVPAQPPRQMKARWGLTGGEGKSLFVNLTLCGARAASLAESAGTAIKHRGLNNGLRP